MTLPLPGHIEDHSAALALGAVPVRPLRDLAVYGALDGAWGLKDPGRPPKTPNHLTLRVRYRTPVTQTEAP